MIILSIQKGHFIGICQLVPNGYNVVVDISIVTISQVNRMPDIIIRGLVEESRRQTSSSWSAGLSVFVDDFFHLKLRLHSWCGVLWVRLASSWSSLDDFVDLVLIVLACFALVFPCGQSTMCCQSVVSAKGVRGVYCKLEYFALPAASWIADGCMWLGVRPFHTTRGGLQNS